MSSQQPAAAELLNPDLSAPCRQWGSRQAGDSATAQLGLLTGRAEPASWGSSGLGSWQGGSRVFLLTPPLCSEPPLSPGARERCGAGHAHLPGQPEPSHLFGGWENMAGSLPSHLWVLGPSWPLAREECGTLGSPRSWPRWVMSLPGAPWQDDAPSQGLWSRQTPVLGAFSHPLPAKARGRERRSPRGPR